MGQDGVAIRIRLGDEAGTDGPASAGTILDHDALAELRRELLDHDARDNICGAASSDGHDSPQRFGRPGLGPRVHRGQPQSAHRHQR